MNTLFPLDVLVNTMTRFRGVPNNRVASPKLLWHRASWCAEGDTYVIMPHVRRLPRFVAEIRERGTDSLLTDYSLLRVGTCVSRMNAVMILDVWTSLRVL